MGVLRKYANIMLVFLVSGLWHGANWHFIVWGAANGLLVIFGQMMKPMRKRICDRLRVNSDTEMFHAFQRAVVFCLITITWVFFRNGVSESIDIIRNMIFMDPLTFFDSHLFSIGGTVAGTFVMAVTTSVFCVMQKRRQNEGKVYQFYSRMPFLLQCFAAAFVICICIFGICAGKGSIDTQFLYFAF